MLLLIGELLDALFKRFAKFVKSVGPADCSSMRLAASNSRSALRELSEISRCVAMCFNIIYLNLLLLLLPHTHYKPSMSDPAFLLLRSWSSSPTSATSYVGSARGGCDDDGGGGGGAPNMV